MCLVPIAHERCFKKIATNEQGLLLRWYSMLVQPERQTSSEPEAEDMYKR